MMRTLLFTALVSSASVLAGCSQSESPVTPAPAPPGNDAPPTATEAATDEMSQLVGADEAAEMSDAELKKTIKANKSQQKQGKTDKK